MPSSGAQKGDKAGISRSWKVVSMLLQSPLDEEGLVRFWWYLLVGLGVGAT